MTRYQSEADLCTAFGDTARRHGWSVFPEVDGWDLVIVRDSVQIGVEAKLRQTWRVLAQALGRMKVPCTHYGAVLVPIATWEFKEMARALGLSCFSGYDMPSLPDTPAVGKGIELPMVALSSPGGRPSPRVLSSWRVAAIRLVQALDRGWVSGHEFDRLGMNRRMFLDSGWMKPAIDSHGHRVWDTRDGRRRLVYERAKPRRPLPIVRYEAEATAIATKDADSTDAVVNFKFPQGE